MTSNVGSCAQLPTFAAMHGNPSREIGASVPDFVEDFHEEPIGAVGPVVGQII